MFDGRLLLNKLGLKIFVVRKAHHVVLTRLCVVFKTSVPWGSVIPLRCTPGTSQPWSHARLRQARDVIAGLTASLRLEVFHCRSYDRRIREATIFNQLVLLEMSIDDGRAT